MQRHAIQHHAIVLDTTSTAYTRQQFRYIEREKNGRSEKEMRNKTKKYSVLLIERPPAASAFLATHEWQMLCGAFRCRHQDPPPRHKYREGGHHTNGDTHALRELCVPCVEAETALLPSMA